MRYERVVAYELARPYSRGKIMNELKKKERKIKIHRNTRDKSNHSLKVIQVCISCLMANKKR